MYMIEIKNVSKTYLGKQVKALDSVSFSVQSGEVLGLVGPNGAGKSTLIKMLVGMLKVDEGDIQICGNSIKSDPLGAKQNIGFVSDNHSVYDKLSGLEFLHFVANAYGVQPAEAKSEIERLVKIFELENAINDSITSYSHGMKQKLCIIASLIHSPKVWVLDEPLTGLDPKGTFNLKQIIKAEKEKGTTVLFSSHMLDMVEKLCDRVAIINKGKLVACGTVEEIRKQSSADLESVFLAITSSESMGDNNENASADTPLQNNAKQTQTKQSAQPAKQSLFSKVAGKLTKKGKRNR